MLSEEKIFKLIAHRTSDMVCIHDSENCIRFATPSCKTILGLSPNEIIGKKLTDFLSEDFINEMDFTTLSRFFDNPGSLIRYQIKHQKKKLRWLETTFSKIKDDDIASEMAVSTTRDITESVNLTEDLMEALSKERELSVFKTNLYSIASHEFKTPLAVIQANIETLKIKKDANILERSLTSMEEEIDHLNEMIADMLELKKLTTGTINFKPAPVNILNLIQELVDEVSKKSYNNITLKLKVETIIQNINGDYSLLRFTISNLISNACKFSQTNGTVEVKLHDNEKHFIVSVKDQGIGIPLKEQAQIFQSFYRATNVGHKSGTGVGLSISKEFTLLHNGFINFKSKPGVGSTFNLHLPL